ncbi:MAG: glycoside hydrolase family 3 C-terminal domain-containing protein [Bacteroides sp.]|nr:glycoside hydrolase family 3 C-terminal domain-containing protein [Bacteroides sp.]
MKRNLLTILAVGLITLSSFTARQTTPVYLDETKNIDERVADALSRMTLEEKVNILHAQSKFSSPGVPRLGIPELWCTDGPHGIRPEVKWDEWNQAGWTNDSCTAFPALTCLAATWDKEASALYGKSIGEEARYREKDVLLGPGVNIYRTPFNGRNFEYMGEDPFLAGEMCVPYIQGVQKNGVAVCLKHFALNNQECNRHTADVDVDDRALYEIYLPAFKKGVEEGDAWSIMASYNLYKGQHLCHNKYLLDDVLKGEWKFDGAVISDWGGACDPDQAAAYGLDLEYGTWTDGLTTKGKTSYDSYMLADPYLERLRDGRASLKTLDDKAGRVLKLIFRTAMNRKKPFGSINSPEHLAAARQIGADGIVLLKNDAAADGSKVLPVDLASAKKILVVGENAIKMMTVGGGSSSLKVKHEVSPLEGIQAAVGNNAEVIYERGYVGSTSNSYNGVTSGQDLSESRTAEQLIADAARAAADADVVLFFGGLNKDNHQDSEGADRIAYGLPYNQDAVIEALAAANPNLAVCLVSGNAVAMPWIGQVRSIAQCWFCGSEAGNSIADVIFGKVNPSGKLPFTFPVRIEDSPAHALGAYTCGKDVHYKESIYVGYRWFDTKGIRPLFAFGHGLSYTEFEYGEVNVSSKVSANGVLKASVKVKNIGSRDGKEIVQLYIGEENPLLERPTKELKAFEKVSLAPGETKTVKFEIPVSDLAYFNADTHSWVLDSGHKFTAYFAAASDDVRGTADFIVR